jgi:hypothetical protein
MTNKIAKFVLAFIGFGFLYTIVAGLLIACYVKFFATGYSHHLEYLLAPILGGLSALIHAFIIANRPEKGLPT